MTTITTDGKCIAGDGQTTLNDCIVCETAVKVRALGSGEIMGFCGDAGDDALFEDWLMDGGKKPKLGRGFSAIILAKSRPMRVYYHDCTFDEPAPPYAIGSGAPFAFAAMDCGKSPTEAVRIASGRCTKTGGKITALSIGD